MEPRLHPLTSGWSARGGTKGCATGSAFANVDATVEEACDEDNVAAEEDAVAAIVDDAGEEQEEECNEVEATIDEGEVKLDGGVDATTFFRDLFATSASSPSKSAAIKWTFLSFM